MRSLFDAWLVVLVTLWTTVCVRVCLESLFDEKLTLLASAAVNEAHFGSWVVVQDDRQTHTQKHLHKVNEHTCSEADGSGSLDVFVSLFVTMRQSPAGVAAGRRQLNNPHLSLPVSEHKYTQTVCVSWP
ncbi:hypothetical protein ATANTOWER_030574 [Ataeniobius toweri]|uniref:Secreted protein n=1 Tax=Ataeniobius toweri TaxID=208326 RepID=A0ABU7B3Q9_9TELE|nr:hypothetical protein [Ataeniobius toweri]